MARPLEGIWISGLKISHLAGISGGGRGAIMFCPPIAKLAPPPGHTEGSIFAPSRIWSPLEPMIYEWIGRRHPVEERVYSLLILNPLHSRNPVYRISSVCTSRATR